MLVNEKPLIDQLINGNEKAFNKIFLFYSPKVYNFCRRFSINTSEAEEIVQIVFTSVWENRSRIDPKLSLLSYLFTAARNQILNSLKKKVYQQGFIEYSLFHEIDSSFVTENEILFNELNLQVEKAINELPPRCREVFLLSRIQELSYREIAEKLSITESTVNTQISKALDYLRQKINQ
jgi:RNA polymerase sigma-70 factor, ECF subfamily